MNISTPTKFIPKYHAFHDMTDGWILAKFFFCVFMDRDEVEVHKVAKKKNEANIQPS